MPEYQSDEEMIDPKDNREENGDDEDGEEEEYEIEQILEAKQGVFENGKTGYLVKWKGYGSDDNSWVNEDDAQGAVDLIKEYWERQKQNKRKPPVGRKSLPTKQREASSDSQTVPSQKRGRTSVSKPINISDDDEQSDRPQPKKAKTSTPSASAAKTKSASVTKSTQKQKKRAPTPEESDEEETFTDMRKWKDAASWEPIVERVDTVERTDDGKLLVYFTLNRKGLIKAGGERCREDSSLCKEKFPKALLEFYERNLRWRQVDEGEQDE